MKSLHKIIVMALAVMTVIAAGIGLLQRRTYTDISRNQNPTETMQVAMWLDEISPDHMEFLKENLPDSPIILRVKGTGKIAYHYFQNLQQATIQEVYKGSDLSVGEDIYLANGSRCYLFSKNQANCGFVNDCQAGQDYLVFLQEKILTPQKEAYPVYTVMPYVIEPIFNYSDIQNKVVSVSLDQILVPYAEVADNEFFAGSESGLAHWLALKRQMLQLYPAGDKLP
ncbi:MAG: hypothetical protein PHP39_08560 [Oscillospiraceae bacterium]|nr:hypothetical protein [Oscillospiraceae bacterium]